MLDTDQRCSVSSTKTKLGTIWNASTKRSTATEGDSAFTFISRSLAILKKGIGKIFFIDVPEAIKK